MKAKSKLIALLLVVLMLSAMSLPALAWNRVRSGCPSTSFTKAWKTIGTSREACDLTSGCTCTYVEQVRVPRCNTCGEHDYYTILERKTYTTNHTNKNCPGY